MAVPRRAVLACAGLSVVAAALAGCSSTERSETTVTTTGTARAARVYVVAPQSGGDAALGVGMANSVKLAFRQAAERNALAGWNVEVVVLDDKSDKALAKEAAQKAASDPQTVAVVGSIFSGLTTAMQQPLAAAGIPQVSPSATNPTLSKGDDYVSHPRRPFGTFFRVSPPDDAHAPALARQLREKGVARVAVVHDGDSYGKGLAEAFTRAFTEAGGRVLSTDTVDPAAPPSYPGLVKKIAALKPQAVMFGGNDPQGGPLSRQLQEAGLTVPLAGGDALATEMFVVKAGPTAARDISTAAGRPLTDVENGRAYLKAYHDGGFAEPATSYGPLGHDAANAVIQALGPTLPGAASAEDARAATAKALQGVAFDGTSGKVAFDEYGDITPRVVTVQTLSGGAWVPTKTYDLG